MDEFVDCTIQYVLDHYVDVDAGEMTFDEYKQAVDKDLRFILQDYYKIYPSTLENEEIKETIEYWVEDYSEANYKG